VLRPKFGVRKFLDQISVTRSSSDLSWVLDRIWVLAFRLAVRVAQLDLAQCEASCWLASVSKQSDLSESQSGLISPPSVKLPVSTFSGFHLILAFLATHWQIWKPSGAPPRAILVLKLILVLVFILFW